MMTYGTRLFSVTLPLLTAMAAISIYAQNAGIPAEGVLHVERISIPAAAELKTGQKKVRELFAGDFKAAKLPAQKWQLAAKLAKEAETTKAIQSPNTRCRWKRLACSSVLVMPCRRFERSTNSA